MMSIADLGSLGEFVSSLAVLFTLIFLTLQMRQNTKAVRASTAAEMTSQWLVNATSGATSAVDARVSLITTYGNACIRNRRRCFKLTGVSES